MTTTPHATRVTTVTAACPTPPDRRTPAHAHDAGAAARALLAEHRDDGTGMCGGCLDEFGQLKPAPCEQARWAADITHAAPPMLAAS